MAQEVKRAWCEMCHSHCRVAVYSKNGRLVKIGEDKTDPRVRNIFPPTRSCLRIREFEEALYHPDRLKFPLKRAGEKGEGKWQQISWEQAFDEIAERLQSIRGRYGAETLALTRGTGRTHHHFKTRFLNLFGSPNITGAGTICYGPYKSTTAAIFGWPLNREDMTGVKLGADGTPERLASKCVLIIGLGPDQSALRVWNILHGARKLGTKLIVLDPRRTETAKIADLWLQLRPGTDGAVLLSMINVIIEEGLYDANFVNNWCYGFDKLTERTRDYPPGRVSEISWVPAEKIREAARMYAINKPAVNTNGVGTEHYQGSIEAIHARAILAAITGNIDIEGGNYLPGPAGFIREPDLELNEMLPPEQKKKQLGADRFKLISLPGYELISENAKRVWGVDEYCWASTMSLAHSPTVYRAMLSGEPYPVRAAITMASNPMLTAANVKLVYKALRSLDLYVVVDWWKTPCAEIADYILPPACWIERPSLSSIGGSVNRISAGEQALPSSLSGEYDRKTDYEILRGLGIRLGQRKFWPWETLEETYDYQLSPLGMTHKEFMAQGGFHSPPNEYKKYQKTGFSTPTGKVELYSTIFEKLGYDPLPSYEEPAETPISSPELAKEYPLIMTTGGRFQWMYHSERRQMESIRKKHPHPLVQLNPETASKLNIEDGDWVWIESPRGTIRMKCQYFDGIDPRVVHCEHGWWFPELPGEEPWLHGVWESNVNVLTTDDPDMCNKLSGGWPLKSALCRIYKCKVY